MSKEGLVLRIWYNRVFFNSLWNSSSSFNIVNFDFSSKWGYNLAIRKVFLQVAMVGFLPFIDLLKWQVKEEELSKLELFFSLCVNHIW